MKKTLAVIAILCAMFAAPRFADAAERCPADAEWCPPSAGPALTWTAPLCGKGKLVAQPYFTYARGRGAFDDKGHYKSYTNGERKYQLLEQVVLYYGITDHLEIDGMVSYMQNYRTADGVDADSTGFGDSILYGRYCLIEETKVLPCVTAIAQLKFPTGKYQKAGLDKLDTDITGTGSYDQGYGIILTKRIKPFIFHADAIYNLPFETRVDGVKTKYANCFNYDAGVEYFLPKGFNLLAEVNGFLQGDRKDDGESVPSSDVRLLMIGLGIGWSCDKVQTLIEYQRVVAGTNCDVTDSVLATFVYTF